MNTTTKPATKAERRQQWLARHYVRCEALAKYCGARVTDGKKVSVKLMQLEQLAANCSEAYCNGETVRVNWPLFGLREYNFRRDGSEAWEQAVSVIKDCLRNILGTIPNGFFVNADARGYALKIDSEHKLALDLTQDMGGYQILSPEPEI